MRPVAYLGWLGGTIAVLALLQLALTIATDPYRLFGTPTLPGWTALKPRIDQQLAMAKTYQMERIAPTTLVLGNSRAEIGLDPASPLWPAARRPVFNAAMAGGNVFLSLLMLRDDLAVQPPQLIVLGLDFYDVLTEPAAPVVPTSAERRLLVDRDGQRNPARAAQTWWDRLAVTLTIDAAKDSLMTLLDQNAATSATMTPLGLNPLHEYRVFVARSGYHALFAQKNAIYRKQYAAYAKPDFADPLRCPACRHAIAMMRLARANRIPLILYIHPYHADYLEMLHDLGFWPSFEAWKRVMTQAAAEIGADTPGAIRLIDFSGYDAFTTEPVPAAGDRRPAMQWYWEPGHYKNALGEHMLATMFGDEPGFDNRTRFGRMLTPKTIDSVLTEIREQRRRFVASGGPAPSPLGAGQ